MDRNDDAGIRAGRGARIRSRSQDSVLLQLPSGLLARGAAMRLAWLAVALCACSTNGNQAPGPDGGQALPDLTPVVKAGACTQLAAAGTWENITPPVAPLHGVEVCPYGG